MNAPTPAHTPLLTRLLAFAVSAVAAWAVGLTALAQTPRPTTGGPPATLNSSAQSRVVIAVRPVGKISYDGLRIPITSPDGRFIATQSGRTPPWDVLLADKTARPPVGLTISAYTVPIDPPAPPAGEKDRKDAVSSKPSSISLIRWPSPFVSNVVLGRAADNLGFLIEAPQNSGSRWIGKAGWLSGEVEWLVRDSGKGVPVVNAHATLANDGAIAFVRREIDASVFQLVLRSRRGSAWTEIVHSSLDRSESYVFPFFSADGTVLAAFAVPTSDLAGGPVSLVAFARPDPQAGPGLSLAEIGRLDVGHGGMVAAFQIASTIQLPCPILAPTPGESPRDAAARDLFQSGLLTLSIRDGTTVWWEPRRALLLSLEPGTAIAVPFQHAELGMLLGGDKDLMCQPLRWSKDRESELQVGRAVSVLAGRAIPRATTHRNAFGATAIAFTPVGSGQENTLHVIFISPAAPE